MDQPVPLQVLLEHLKWHLQRMHEDQKKEASVYFRDAALQRFEFTFKSALKCIEHASGNRVKPGDSPQTVLEAAQAEGWLPADTVCRELVESYLGMAPEHRQEHAETIFARLPDIYSRFQFLYQQLAALQTSSSN